MARRKYFSYKMPYRPWNWNERYVRLNVAATRASMMALSSEEFLIWLYYAVLAAGTYYHFSVEEMRKWAGMTGKQVKAAITHFFELGYLTFANSPTWYFFHAIPVASNYSGEKHHYNFTIYIDENATKEIPNATYCALNLDALYEARAALSPNGFKFWLELNFAYPKCEYSYAQSQSVGINYEGAFWELGRKSYLVRSDLGGYHFLRFGKQEEEQIEV